MVTLCTVTPSGYPEARSVLNTLNSANESLILHFFTGNSSHKAEQLKKNKLCCLYYFNEADHVSMRLFGIVAPYSGENKAQFWRDDWKNFGYSGADDQNWLVGEFTPRSYKYYDRGKECTGEISGADLK
jgi:general stress protein 26